MVKTGGRQAMSSRRWMLQQETADGCQTVWRNEQLKCKRWPQAAATW